MLQQVGTDSTDGRQAVGYFSKHDTMIDHHEQRVAFHEGNILSSAESAAEVICNALGFDDSALKDADIGPLILATADLYSYAHSLTNPGPRLTALKHALEPSLDRVVRWHMRGE